MSSIHFPVLPSLRAPQSHSPPAITAPEARLYHRRTTTAAAATVAAPPWTTSTTLSTLPSCPFRGTPSVRTTRPFRCRPRCRWARRTTALSCRACRSPSSSQFRRRIRPHPCQRAPMISATPRNLNVTPRPVLPRSDRMWMRRRWPCRGSKRSITRRPRPLTTWYGKFSAPRPCSPPGRGYLPVVCHYIFLCIPEGRGGVNCMGLGWDDKFMVSWEQTGWSIASSIDWLIDWLIERGKNNSDMLSNDWLILLIDGIFSYIELFICPLFIICNLRCYYSYLLRYRSSEIVQYYFNRKVVLHKVETSAEFAFIISHCLNISKKFSFLYFVFRLLLLFQTNFSRSLFCLVVCRWIVGKPPTDRFRSKRLQQ